MPAHQLMKRDWQRDHVYLIQYPRCKVMPNASPWSFKLETWLRMANIAYTGISNEFKKFSAKGQVPFVELNGRQSADSSLIISHLKEEFNKTELDPATDDEKALAVALGALVGEQLNWTVVVIRLREKELFGFKDALWGKHIQGAKGKILKSLLTVKIKKTMKSRCHAQGFGRLSDDEIVASAIAVFDALSVLLGEKPFFFGRPTTFDATAFAWLALFIYTPMPDHEELVAYLKESRPNLADFVTRMRERYWPDWEETCDSFDMNTHHKKEEEEKK